MTKKYIIAATALLAALQATAQTNDSIPSDTLGITMSDTLGTAVVTARRIQRDARGTTLMVTNKLRGKHHNALSMLREVPGIRYNPTSEEIKINGSSSIAYQVNGVDKTAEEIRTTPVDAIQAIEVLHEVDGKHLAEGVRYVVNVKLKESYTGLDLFAQNFLIASPSGDNGDDVVACEQPKLSMRYKGRKLNVNATAGYGDFDWNFAQTTEKAYGEKSLCSAPYSPQHPNQETERNEWGARVAADYVFGSNNLLSLTAFYSPSRSKESTHNAYFSEGSTTPFATEHTASDVKENNLKLNVNYRGGKPEAWTYELNTGLNFINSDNTRSYFDGLDCSLSPFEQNKRYAYGKVGTQYHGIDKWVLDFGGMYTYNNYATLTPETNQLNTHRYNVYGYASYKPTSCWNIHAGLTGAGLYSPSRPEAGQKAESRFLLQPTLSASYVAKNQMVAFDLKYSLAPTYPKLYQLYEAAYKVDEVVTHLGNPALRQLSSAHSLTGVLTLLGALQLQTELAYNRNGVFSYYTPKADGGVLLSYANARTLTSASALGGEFGFGPFTLDLTLGVQYNHVANSVLSQHKADLLGGVSLDYYNDKLGFGATAEWSKNKETQCMLQGFRESNQDLFQLTLQKHWLHRRLRAELTYILPVHWGMSTSQKESVNTDFYRMQQNLNLGTYDNMLFLRLSYQFHRGKKTKRVTDSGIFDNEQRIGRNLIGQE